ncbi:RluA family pseudouridine synthase [Nannocystis bainbridge]|uniref:Pseudouridine synthase n=1 Tax=Nannocystis bainbridge TaxID=2995303 RepID=A0ABT5EEG9_9BACT|nr:pseudouridine synthase [Nannocystis bainbridge]MDC0723226.1 pseudouridine synthase [Nannocystis bainbridge]
MSMSDETCPSGQQDFILYRDDRLLIVAKPAGLVVHRGWADDEVALLDLAREAVGAYVYPVHRLDRGASGALAFALDSATARAMQEVWTSGQVEKRYLALVRGNPPAAVTIDHPIPRAEDGPRVPAVTEVTTLARAGRYALVEARPLTGRLHQIRRHLKHISCPLIGDVRYGKGEHNRWFREHHDLHRLALHAWSLALPHPHTGARVAVKAPLPADLAGALAGLGITTELVAGASAQARVVGDGGDATDAGGRDG